MMARLIAVNAGLRAFERGGETADEEQQLARFRMRPRAGDRRVEQFQAFAGRGLTRAHGVGQLANPRGRHGARFDQHRARSSPRPARRPRRATPRATRASSATIDTMTSAPDAASRGVAAMRASVPRERAPRPWPGCGCRPSAEIRRAAGCAPFPSPSRPVPAAPRAPSSRWIHPRSALPLIPSVHRDRHLAAPRASGLARSPQ